MLDLLAIEAYEPGKLSDLMRRALNYLHAFWKQLFAYRNDGEYTINTFITTCRQVGVSFRDYFRMLMKELGTGRTDYENLLPMTIGL